MKIKFAISSHIGFYNYTYPILIPSLIEAGVPHEDIYFFIGGNENYSQQNKDNINIWNAPHNSIDFTGLISIIELGLESDYWFLLHDTCYVGPNFYKCIQEHNHNKDTVSLSFDLSMNIGSYKQSYLSKRKNEILSFKNTDDNSLQTYKQMLVKEEDVFLTKEDQYTTENRQHLGEEIFYNGVSRIKEYFPKIDLYKLKSNWYSKETYSLTI
jgi:hypothetical protein